MPYVLLSLSLNWMMVILFAGGSTISSQSNPLLLLEACSQSMLPLFLLANLMTGCVNLTVNSLLVPNGHAIVIVSGYMLTVCCVACMLHSRSIHVNLTKQHAVSVKQWA